MRSTRPILTALLASTWLAGCSLLPVTVVDGELVARDRWHRGTAVRTVADADLPPRLRPACADARPDAGRQWLLIDHRPDRAERRTAVPLSAGEQVADGTPLLVLAQGCRRAWAPRPPAARASAAP